MLDDLKNTNNSTDAVHALMVAAGRGSRFGSDLPKQYLLLTDKTVLEESLACLDGDGIDDLTLVIAKDDTYFDKLNLTRQRPLFVGFGGLERWQSVHSGVSLIRARDGRDDDWVVIHDAARPCLPKADLTALLTALEVCNADAAILATPVVDTLKQVSCEGLIEKTVDRSTLWQAQTPQAFRLKTLEMVLDKVAELGLDITDEASAFEMLGYRVQIVQGSRLNMKLTYPDDLPLLRLIHKQLTDE
ncbi:2-C-methyl-D-erythritol 4-phosphate cytidylyltransferase [Moraxella haemolytica]|uniref:2-C-methyl-D-erythritol 4-phosphate cytidylyltransferase n=1 Tax=Moraxella TaxID=475 RepID=UPI0025434B01|nr:2-C-methyl-D-erythritol 4-phosphate cytidylyltransferase [Moraxella sp. ZY171148]WII94746.1 2-C-methyl-D-erythritol 4-phosphate cytidylyltransferase [Moraxella sp. ZY171148]